MKSKSRVLEGMVRVAYGLLYLSLPMKVFLPLVTFFSLNPKSYISQ